MLRLCSQTSLMKVDFYIFMGMPQFQENSFETSEVSLEFVSPTCARKAQYGSCKGTAALAPASDFGCDEDGIMGGTTKGGGTNVGVAATTGLAWRREGSV